MLYAEVAIPKPIPKPLIYAVPEALQEAILAGQRVTVPFHSGQASGFIISVGKKTAREVDVKKIKDIAEIMEIEPVFSKSMIELILWMSKYYCAPIGEVCRAALPPRLSQIKGPELHTTAGAA